MGYIKRLLLRARAAWGVHKIFRKQKANVFALHGTISVHFPSILKEGLRDKGYNWLPIPHKPLLRDILTKGRTYAYRQLIKQLTSNMIYAADESIRQNQPPTMVGIVLGRPTNKVKSISEWRGAGGGLRKDEITQFFSLSKKEKHELERRFPDVMSYKHEAPVGPDWKEESEKSFERRNQFRTAAAQFFAKKIIRWLSHNPHKK